jgi:hypothetical protein
MDVNKDQCNRVIVQDEINSGAKRKAEIQLAGSCQKRPAPWANKEDLLEDSARPEKAAGRQIGLQYKDIITAPIPQRDSKEEIRGPTKTQMRIEELLRMAKDSDDFVALFQKEYKPAYDEYQTKISPKETEEAHEELRRAHVESYGCGVDPNILSQRY